MACTHHAATEAPRAAKSGQTTSVLGNSACPAATRTTTEVGRRRASRAPIAWPWRLITSSMAGGAARADNPAARSFRGGIIPTSSSNRVFPRTLRDHTGSVPCSTARELEEEGGALADLALDRHRVPP